MNIAFVLPYLAERFGGPVTVVKNVGGALASAGHNVSYWATADNSDREELDSIDSAHIFDTVWPRSWHRSRDFVRGLSAAISSLDILHLNEFWPHPVYAASRIGRVNDVPYIVSPAGSLGPWALRSNRLKWFKKATYLHIVGKTVIQHAACLHAASMHEAENFRRLGYRGPVTIIPNGVDTDEFTGGDRSEAEDYWPNLRDRLVVLFMSRLSPEKGLDLLIPAWADVVKCPAYKDAVLVIAGPDDRGYRKVVERLIDKFNISSQTRMMGMIRGQKKLALLRRANVFVLPSYSENFGIVVAEALSCGTPVITTTGTPWQQLQEIDAGRWVPPQQGEIGQALREMLNMPDSQRKAMGQRGMALIKQNYTWDRVVPKFLTVYNCILSGKPIPLHP